MHCVPLQSDQRIQQSLHPHLHEPGQFRFQQRTHGTLTKVSVPAHSRRPFVWHQTSTEMRSRPTPTGQKSIVVLYHQKFWNKITDDMKRKPSLIFLVFVYTEIIRQPSRMGRSPRRPHPCRNRGLRSSYLRASTTTKSSRFPEGDSTTTTTTTVRPTHELQSAHWSRDTLNHRLRVFRLDAPSSPKSESPRSLLYPIRDQYSSLGVSEPLWPTHPNPRITPGPPVTELEPIKLNITSSMDGQSTEASQRRRSLGPCSRTKGRHVLPA